MNTFYWNRILLDWIALKYYKRNYNNKLKYVSTDTSFIPNKKGKDLIGYNKFYNRKNGTKISLITDSKGIPFNLKCYNSLIFQMSNYY